MYYDFSLPATSTLDLTHILRNLPPTYCAAAIDHHFTDTTITPPSDSFTKIKEITTAEKLNLKLYSRATLAIEHNHTLHQINQTPNNGYDIMAVQPKTEKIFHTLCVQYDNYDIITLDLGAKLPFMLKRNPVYEALRKGKYFQIRYACMFDDNTRVVAMTNMINLIKATQGKNLIVSSNAENINQHRTPYDVAALLASMGLPKNQALATMKENAQTLLKSAIHRKYFKSAIQEIPPQMVDRLSRRIKKHKNNLKQILQKKQQKEEQAKKA